jgi:hypothetical protein
MTVNNDMEGNNHGTLLVFSWKERGNEKQGLSMRRVEAAHYILTTSPIFS